MCRFPECRNGKRPKSFPTGFSVGQEEKARDLIAELENQAAQGQAIQVRRPVPRVGAVLSVAAFSEQFVAERRARGVVSFDKERLHFRYLRELADRPLPEVTKAEALAWVRRLASSKGEAWKRFAPATVKKVSATVRMVFKEAAKRDLIAVSPCVWDASDLPRKVTAARSLRVGYTAEEDRRGVDPPLAGLATGFPGRTRTARLRHGLGHPAQAREGDQDGDREVASGPSRAPRDPHVVEAGRVVTILGAATRGGRSLGPGGRGRGAV